MANLNVVRSIWINAPREQVWDAVSNPDRVITWLVPNLPGAAMKRDASGRVQVFMGEMGIDFAMMEMNEPLKQVSYQGLPEGLFTSTYALEDKDNGTQVTVTMTGFDRVAANAREDRLAESGSGWEKTLANLKAHAEGADLPNPQAFVGPLMGHRRKLEKATAVERSIWMAAPRERVWQAIVDPKQMQQWFSPTTEWNLSAQEVGGRYYVVNEETKGEMYVAVIEVLDPPSQLILRNEPGEGSPVARTSYALTEEKSGTRLTLTYTRYEEPTDAFWGEMEQHSFGFGMVLQNVRAVVEGTPLPFPFGF
jgi:uncharacterized protein YndB with AHSA1/START domain